MRAKLRAKNGESLVESLASILVISVSAALLAIMISVAVGINLKANAATNDLYEQLSAAETGGGDVVSGTVTVNGMIVNVNYYGKTGGLTAYGK